MKAGSVFLRATRINRHFDVSKSWLERTINGEPRRFLRAVENVSFEIAAGETFGLVGESGCGKSTLGRIAVGLLEPTSGSIEIEDRPLATFVRRGRLHMIFQDPFASLNPRWRVKDIVAEPLRARGTSATAAQTRVAELLSTVGLSSKDGRKFPHEFSGGQRQRIAIARALASDADFIVCDEPTSALDVSVQAQILNLARDLQEEFGLTLLFISHNLAVVRHMADRVGVMYLGRIVEIAPADLLFDAPRHPYSRYLIDSIPDPHAFEHERIPVSGEIPSAISPPPGCAFHPRCPLAFDRCRREVPALIEGVACHAVNGAALEAFTTSTDSR
jgi:peptide/nickel transport system ATP-binding protein